MTLPDDPAFAGINSGLTIREYFAALALQGCLAMYAGRETGAAAKDRAARHAVGYADALIAELNKHKETT